MAPQPGPGAPPPAGKGKGPLGKLDRKQKLVLGGLAAGGVVLLALIRAHSTGGGSTSAAGNTDAGYGGSGAAYPPADFTGDNAGDSGNLDAALMSINEQLAQIVAHENP